MTRLSLSDVAQMLIDQAERDRIERAEDRKLLREAIEALTAPRTPQLPAETFTIKRAAVGEKVDVFETNLVRQEGESRDDMIAQGQELHEKLAMRYPLSDGRTHVWPLDQGSDPDPTTKLANDLRASVKDGAK